MRPPVNLSSVTRSLVDRIIRVDHAGELGANRIYQGQLAILGRSHVGPKIKVFFELNLILLI